MNGIHAMKNILNKPMLEWSKILVNDLTDAVVVNSYVRAVAQFLKKEYGVIFDEAPAWENRFFPGSKNTVNGIYSQKGKNRRVFRGEW